MTSPGETSEPQELVTRADTEWATGRWEAAVALYERAHDLARTVNDDAVRARAALGLAKGQAWGSHPGRLPVVLHEAYQSIESGPVRVRLAAALARCWAYSGEPSRAVPFADEAVVLAEQVGDPTVIADALDAALATHWGPDELQRRERLAGQLAEVAAHLVDVDSRLQADLWGLTVGLETLDMPRVHRRVRALDALAEESARATFFAASRRLSIELLEGRWDTSDQLLAVAQEAAATSGIPDSFGVLHAMAAYPAWFAGAAQRCAYEAEYFEAYGIGEGVRAVCAEAMMLWLGAGKADRAMGLLAHSGAGHLDAVPRDADWMLTIQLVLESALAIGVDEVVGEASALLAPYEGRAVINAGGVMFHGVTDDPLSRAAELRGDTVEARRLRTQALATYERIGARWWYDRLSGGTHSFQLASDPRMVLHPAPGGTVWFVGREGATGSLPPLKGLKHLHALISRPGAEVRAVDLIGLETGAGAAMPSGDLGETLDSTARDTYRRRLRELDEELAEAEDWTDAGLLERLSFERTALLDELRHATGLGGRSRRTGSTDERARVTVRKSIVSALDRIEAVDATLARLLRTRVRTGTYCRYDEDPDRPTRWVLEAPNGD